MAQATREPDPAQPSAPTQRTPAVIATERMAKLASAGADRTRMVSAVDAVLIEWAAEEMSPSDLRERVEQLQSDIDAGLEAALDVQAEAETPGQKTAAAAKVNALQAVRDRLTKVIEG